MLKPLIKFVKKESLKDGQTPHPRLTNIQTRTPREIPEPLKESDLKLGSVFSIWGKSLSNSFVFEYCNGEEGIVKMFVNRKPTTEFENYLIRYNDVIAINIS